MDKILEFVSQLGDFAGYVAVILAVTQLLKDAVFTGVKGFGVQLMSFLIAVAIAFVGAWSNVGVFQPAHGMVSELWYALLIMALGGTLVANGASTYPKIQRVLQAFFRIFKIPLLPDKRK
ncbi:MAG: hypothetical protein KGY70_11480 [Bacteroidales bacterium]|nr:hypothetical protein [Bacteroidales bacterium]